MKIDYKEKPHTPKQESILVGVIYGIMFFATVAMLCGGLIILGALTQ